MLQRLLGGEERRVTTKTDIKYEGDLKVGSFSFLLIVFRRLISRRRRCRPAEREQTRKKEKQQKRKQIKGNKTRRRKKTNKMQQENK